MGVVNNMADENTSDQPDQPVSSCSGLRQELLQCLLASECVREVRDIEYRLYDVTLTENFRELHISDYVNFIIANYLLLAWPNSTRMSKTGHSWIFWRVSTLASGIF